jgi:hypothetical protein
MIEIKRIDLDWFRSSRLDYRDDGPVSKGAKTRQFSVFSRANRSLLGYVKWWTNWRQYCFFPLNSLFNYDCLREIAQFCEEATRVHKDRLPKLKTYHKRLAKEARERRMAKLALTKSKQNDTMVLSEVEAVGDATGKCSDKEVIKSNPEPDKNA